MNAFSQKLMKFHNTWVSMAGIILGMAIWPFPLMAENEKPKIISLDYCADQFLLLLADRNQIISVSKTAEENFSFFSDRAKGLHKNNSSIEEVIMMAPDIVIQTYSSAARMAEMTQKSNIILFTTSYGSNPEIVTKNIQEFGEIINQQERASSFNETYLNRLHKLKSTPSINKTIAYITPGGVTAGKGTSVDDIIKLSGFKNYASEQGFTGWINIPLENLILDPPDIFITSFYDRTTSIMSNWSLSRHSFLNKMMGSSPTINLPSSYMSCNGLFLVDAAEFIRKGIHNFTNNEKGVK